MLKLLLCIKYLFKKKIVLLSIIAVAISTALHISVASLFGGYIKTLEESTTRNLGDIVIRSDRGKLSIEDYKPFIEAVDNDDDFEAATPVLTVPGLVLLGKGRVRECISMGIEPVGYSKVTDFSGSLLEAVELDNFFGGDGEPQGFIGIALASEPDVETDEYNFEEVNSFVGSRAILMTGAQTEFADDATQGYRQRKLGFNIKGIIRTGYYSLDKTIAVFGIEELSRKLYPSSDEGEVFATSIQIKISEDSDIAACLEKVSELWYGTAKRFGTPSVVIKSSFEMQAYLIAEYTKQMNMLMLIFGIVSGGVVLLIACIFYMIIMTRQRDIAIIKSFGASFGTVFSVFATFGFTVGIVGSVLGVLFGWLFISNVNEFENFIRVVFDLKIWKASSYMFSTIPNKLDVAAGVRISIAAVLASVVGSLVPAVYAAVLKPLKILRYE